MFETIFLILPGLALLGLLYAIASQRPDPTRAVITKRERPRASERDPERRRRRSRGIEI